MDRSRGRTWRVAGARDATILRHGHDEHRAVDRLLAAASSSRASAARAAAGRRAAPEGAGLFHAGGELDHVLFAQQAMRAFGASAGAGGYTFAATSDWDALDDATLRDVRVVIWLNDMPHTPAQRAGLRTLHDGRRRLARLPRLGLRQQRVAVVQRVPRRRPLQRQQLAVAAGAGQRRRRRASDRAGRAARRSSRRSTSGMRGRRARAPTPTSRSC